MENICDLTRVIAALVQNRLFPTRCPIYYFFFWISLKVPRFKINDFFQNPHGSHFFFWCLVAFKLRQLYNFPGSIQSIFGPFRLCNRKTTKTDFEICSVRFQFPQPKNYQAPTQKISVRLAVSAVCPSSTPVNFMNWTVYGTIKTCARKRHVSLTGYIRDGEWIQVITLLTHRFVNVLNTL